MKRNLFIAATSLLFIARFFLFISSQDIGVEHDSGWYLGVARNVAERGIYASYTNTIATTEKVGGFPSIHNRFSVQDKNGYNYFPAGVTVGPTYVLSEAVFLKLFGYGWIQYRLLPFISFCILLPVLFFIILQIGSYVGLIFFQLWLWCYPQLFLTLSFEAFSEHIALLLLFIGFLLFQKWLDSPKKNGYIILSGLSFGLSIQTKNLYLLGFLFTIIFLLLITKKERSIRSLSLFLLFLSLPTLLFEIYRFVVLFTQFGFAGWWANNIDIKRTWQSGGSGIQALRNGLNIRFVYNKLSVWKHIGTDPYFFIWPLILISPFLRKKKSYLYWTLLTSTFVFFVWFGTLSTTGWFRHALPGVIMGMIIVSIGIEDLFKKAVDTKKLSSIFIYILFLGSIISTFVTSPLALHQFTITKKQATYLYMAKSPNKMQGPLFAPPFSKKDQEEVMTYINKDVSSTTRICFYEWALIAELPPLVDRVFYPYPRCKQEDILIIGPYQKGIYAINNVNVPFLIQTLCNGVVLNNTTYTVCKIKKINTSPAGR
jgi:hypothetical protein